MDCRVQRLVPLRADTSEPPTFEWLTAMAKLGSGVLSLNHLGGSFRFRDSPVRNLLEWGKHWNLTVLPGSPEVYEQYIAHRVLVQGVDISTVEQDFIALSVLHASLKASIPGLWWHNPTKQDLIRVFLKYLSKEVKLQCEVTVPFSFINFVMMISALDRKSPLQLHARVVLQTVGFAGLRRVAATNLYLKRLAPVLFSLNYDFDASDVVQMWDDTFGWCTGLAISVDKNAVAGRTRWVWIPNNMVCGLTYGDDVRLWLSSYCIPDGPFLAAPANQTATKFRTTPYSAIDNCLARSWRACFPKRVNCKISPYSLRKMIIQALHDWCKVTNRFSHREVGEFIGWISTKTDIQQHYAGLDMGTQCEMLAYLDPAKLPFEIVTSGVGPQVWCRNS